MTDHNRVDPGGIYGPHDEAADPDCSGTRCPSCDCCHHCDHRGCECQSETCGCFVWPMS